MSFRWFGVAWLLAALVIAAPAGARVSRGLPAPLAADCGRGVPGNGFVAYACGSGAAGTRYSHPAELLVQTSSGSLVGYRNSISEPDLMARSADREVVTAHNDAIVQVTARGLKPLVDQRQLLRLAPGSRGLVAVNSLDLRGSGLLVFGTSYYAGHDGGCFNVRAVRLPQGRIEVLARSAPGGVCS